MRNCGTPYARFLNLELREFDLSIQQARRTRLPGELPAARIVLGLDRAIPRYLEGSAGEDRPQLQLRERGGHFGQPNRRR